VETLDRWERLFRIAVRPGDDTTSRQTRLVATMGRVAGNTLAQLAELLAPLLAIPDPSNVTFLETIRADVDAGLTVTTGAVSLPIPTSGSPLVVTLGKPWPGVIDRYGVHVLVSLSAAVAVTATLTAPDGTTWAVPVTGAGGTWVQTRTVFYGKAPAGAWNLALLAAAPVNLAEFRLMASNDVDARSIYFFHVYRDPSLPGVANIADSQRVLRKTAVAHYQRNVCERIHVLADDPRSLCDREPLGV
jgi:hypothetical protein